MKESVYTAYEDLPLFLNAETVAKLLGISISSSYELMHEKGFPSLRIGSPLLAKNSPPDCFLDAQTFSGSSPWQRKKSRKRLFFFGRGDRTWTCGILVPNAFMMALSAENGFFRPFPLGKPRSLAHSCIHCFRVLRNGRWSVVWSAGIYAE